MYLYTTLLLHSRECGRGVTRLGRASPQSRDTVDAAGARKGKRGAGEKGF